MADVTLARGDDFVQSLGHQFVGGLTEGCDGDTAPGPSTAGGDSPSDSPTTPPESKRQLPPVKNRGRIQVSLPSSDLLSLSPASAKNLDGEVEVPRMGDRNPGQGNT